MRRVVLWLASTATIVVLLFGYHTSTNKTSSPGVPSSSGSSTAASGGEPSTSSSSSSSSSASSRSSSSSSSSGSSQQSKSYTGSTVQTRWGPVQVQITVAGNKLTKVTILQQPNGNPRDTEINDYALPILVQATLEAQSAKIDMVSGATVTSDGYLGSLQSALDEAGI